MFLPISCSKRPFATDFDTFSSILCSKLVFDLHFDTFLLILCQPAVLLILCPAGSIRSISEDTKTPLKNFLRGVDVPRTGIELYMNIKQLT